MSDVTLEELAARLHEEALVLLDVRSDVEYTGEGGYPCDARRGHVPGARHIDLQVLSAASAPDEIRALVGAAPGSEVILYCHTGGRSAIAAQIVAAAGYAARNYPGSWHEWAASDQPVELGRPAA